MEELLYIQSKLHAPKDAYNQFGKYKYRKAEQILEAAKPFLLEKCCTLVVSDEIVPVGNYIYIKATSTLTNKKGDTVQAVGWAREAESLSGMSPGQITGATSSYARKYSLCGLFAIDDTKDLDDENVTNPQPKQGMDQNTVARQPQKSMEDVLKEIEAATTKEALTSIFNQNKALQANPQFIGALKARKDKILNNNGVAAA